MEDTMTGVAVAVLSIPLGMGYLILGNVEPTVGLYMSVFPMLVYGLLGRYVKSHDDGNSFLGVPDDR